MPEAMGRRVPVVQTTEGRYRSGSPPSYCQLQLRGAVHQRLRGRWCRAPRSSSTVCSLCAYSCSSSKRSSAEPWGTSGRVGRVGTVSGPPGATRTSLNGPGVQRSDLKILDFFRFWERGMGAGASGALRPAAGAGRKKVARPTYIDPRWSVPPVHDVLWPLA